MRSSLVIGTLAAVLFAFTVQVDGSEHCPADLNNDNVVNASDLAMLLGTWGPCSASCSDGILNGDESGIDCGGDECPPCDEGNGCLSDCDCASGSCVDGECAPACVPQLEICDGQDNDCNGGTDEGNPGGGMACDTGLPGACEAGTSSCQGGALVCVQNNQPTGEICDNQDNDCNGIVDEGNPGGGANCNTGLLGICAQGTVVCQNGSLFCNQNNQPTPEVCDGLDNNCNGQVDEGNPGGGAACNTGLQGICAFGTTSCQSGALTCVQNFQPMPEVCDGQDNNCNGQVDEGNPGGGGVCNTGLLGICAVGTVVCQSGSLFCSQNNQPTPEVCDGLDNNCNGTVDEGNPGGGAACDGPDGDLCLEGIFVCTAGALVCNDATGTNLEACDGFDNDCDGFTDEGCEQ